MLNLECLVEGETHAEPPLPILGTLAAEGLWGLGYGEVLARAEEGVDDGTRSPEPCALGALVGLVLVELTG